MTSEVFVVAQTLLLVVIVSWAKAGLAEWSDAFIALTIIVGLIGAPLLHYRDTGSNAGVPWKSTFPILIFVIVGHLGLLNPSYKNLEDSFAYAEKEELELLAKREFALGGDPVFIDRVMREMYIFRRQVELGNQSRALARFHLAYRYASNQSKTTLLPSFERYLEDIRSKSSGWFPGTVTKETSWRKLCLLALVFLQGIWVYSYLRKRRLLRLLLGILAINCVLLALAGIFQKVSFSPNSVRPEIWGIWEAPEPRYFFASFTYKNHWCAYAVLGIGVLAGLVTHWLRRHPRDLFWRSPVPIALLGIAILAASAPLSGSVLGTLLMLTVSIPFVGFLCYKLLPKGWGWSRGLIGCLIAISLPAIGSWFVLEASPEIKRETLQKISDRWKSLQEGRLPWRYYHSKDSWTMFQDKPLWGWGLGSTAPLYPLYVSNEIIAQTEKQLAYAHHNERFLGLEYSHNDWFQYLAETGVVGVALLITGPLLALRRKRLSRSVTVWTVCACGALLLFSFVDFPSRTPACAILFAVVLGSSLKYAAQRQIKEKRPKSSLPMCENDTLLG